mmetsp:Transcript_28251/g.84261  ORF Transcript_28251/g.84261 Transcript_28251/m.84261 type:complete len:235 (-) Transcript_28251:328-1032(-)
MATTQMVQINERGGRHDLAKRPAQRGAELSPYSNKAAPGARRGRRGWRPSLVLALRAAICRYETVCERDMRDADAAEHALGELGRALRLDEESEVDGEVPRLRLYHRDDAPSGGRRVAVDGNLEDAGGGGEGLLELLAQDGGGALVADSLAHDPRARLDAGDDLEAAVPPRVARVRGGEGAQQLVRRPRRRRGEDTEVEDELQHAAATGRDDQRDDKDRGERGGGPLLQRVGRR